MAASRVEMLPAVKARIRKRDSRNIGSGERVSMTQKAASSMTPPDSSPITEGLVHPMVWPP